MMATAQAEFGAILSEFVKARPVLQVGNHVIRAVEFVEEE
jgi:hypothetical protein